MQQIFTFSYDFCCSFLNNFIYLFSKLITFIVCSLKDSQKFFMLSLPLCISCLFSILSNDDIIDIEKPDGICSLTLVLDEFVGFFLHPSVFSTKHPRST